MGDHVLRMFSTTKFKDRKTVRKSNWSDISNSSMVTFSQVNAGRIEHYKT